MSKLINAITSFVAQCPAAFAPEIARANPELFTTSRELLREAADRSLA